MELSPQQLQAMGMTPAQVAALGAQGFKSQAWMLYDTVASQSFLIGGVEPNLGQVNALGTSGPAVNRQGELNYFDAGRTRNNPGVAYTNMDSNSTLAYGMEVWAIYCTVLFPSLRSLLDDGGGGLVVPFPRAVRLAEAIINHAVIAVRLGQEFDQVLAPSHKFGSGGAFVSGSDLVANPINGLPGRQNVMVLPEPIEMPRTQNLSVKQTLSPEAIAFLGNAAAPGVGLSLPPVTTTFLDGGGNAVAIDVPELPYAVQIGLIGKRIKHTQYGQTAGG